VVRAYLARLAAAGRTVTYRDAAAELEVAPPRSIHKLTEALERAMDEDAAAGRPFAAAMVVSRAREGLPAPGFFAKARALGRYQGPETGPEAARFHREELAAAQAASAE
jgi:hypothetical protein